MSYSMPLSSNNPYALRINTNIPGSINSPQLAQTTFNVTKVPASAFSEKLVSLHRLNGTPYHTLYRQLETVAEDKNNDRDLPEYTSRASHISLEQSDQPRVPRQQTYCDKCGRQTQEVSQSPRSITEGECHKCGKRKATVSKVVQGRDNLQHPVSLLPGRLAILAAENNSPALLGTTASQKKTCRKCGKPKRPIIPTPVENAPTTDLFIAPPPSVHHIVNQHKAYGQPQLQHTHMEIRPIRRKPVPSHALQYQDTNNDFDFNIVTPSAMSETMRPSPLTVSSTAQYPLLQTYELCSQYEPRRNSSISSMASSIVKSLSIRTRRSQNNDEHTSLRTQQLCHGSKHMTNDLFTTITNVLREKDSREYLRLHNSDEVEGRSVSPFSFLDRPSEDSIELADIPKASLDLDDKWDAVDLSTPYTDENSSSDGDHGCWLPQSGRAPRQSSSPPFPVVDIDSTIPGNHNGLSRFKSFRNGVQHAGSVARSTSLRRLNSLKNAPQYWYRNDMAIEGAAIDV